MTRMKVSGKGLLEGHQSYTLAVTVLPGIGDSLLHYPDLMAENGARVEPINGTKMLAQIYDEAVKWAVQC